GHDVCESPLLLADFPYKRFSWRQSLITHICISLNCSGHDVCESPLLLADFPYKRFSWRQSLITHICISL
ncbi:hypothetical protein, partial [Shigella sonnei]|uniref:hypothetical protein n=1 Tax=Shigella sonnei TaxID=624 RepID=UPI001C0A7A30